MNVPALRGLSLPTGAVTLSTYDRLTLGTFPQPGAFSAFDSAFISAAHQVSCQIYLCMYVRGNVY